MVASTCLNLGLWLVLKLGRWWGNFLLSFYHAIICLHYFCIGPLQRNAYETWIYFYYTILYVLKFPHIGSSMMIE